MDFGPETRFRDRAEAGVALAARLVAYRAGETLVLGVPRGGVPIAAEVAARLDAELDVVVAHKLGAPGRPELAIGAVTADGGLWLNREYIDGLDVPADYVEREIDRQRHETALREQRMRAEVAPKPVHGRVVMVVDDGVATGATMIAALRSVRGREPSRLIAAVPVASISAIRALEREADEVVCLSTPDPFYAVGYYYDVFEQVPDEVARLLLRAAGTRRTVARSSAETASGARP